MELQSDSVLGKWPEAMKMTMEAFETDDYATWCDALRQCQDFRIGIKERLEYSDIEAQAFNRDKVLPFSLQV